MSGKTDVSAFERDGFAVVPQLADAKDVAAMREAYDSILNGTINGGAFDRNLGDITRQIMIPHLIHPAFGDSPVIERARKVAGDLMGRQAPNLFYSMLIYKPPGHPHETPWHQDIAYVGRPFTEAGASVPNNAIVQFWLALDDVDADMGCMEFVPGAHLHPMPAHHVASGDPDDEGRLLATTDPESAYALDEAIVCPLRAGDATVHGYMTPHRTGPNRSEDRDRPAFIFSFAEPEILQETAGRMEAQ
ncbi:MAG: phytanoyl-CoA dioxygenase family protein [Pseudomonadota bacterium]